VITALIFVLGLAALVAGASILVRGASRLALRLGLSPLVVGLTVVAFGTSAPEMAVSVDAVLAGRAGLAVGNAVGSNIFNVLFILGLAALVTPLAVHRQVIRQEAPIMIGGAILVLVLSVDGRLGLFDTGLLLALMVAYTVYLVRQSRAELAGQAEGSQDEFADELRPAAPDAWDARLPVQLALIAGGLVLLVVGSDALVSSAVVFASALGMSDAVIGLTIVAAGTSLPEVAASLAASLKGERDIAVGNVVGSCVFNLFGVIGLAGLVASLSGLGVLLVPPDVLRFDLWVMLAALVVCLPVFLTGREISRWEGGLFLAYYVAYTTYLVLATQHRHEQADVLGEAMMSYVIPLTLVTLGVSMMRRKASG
jgi:cation:H+ antiporter